MKVSKLLELDKNNTHQNILPGAFGDGYLLQKNQIYRNIRAQAVHLKVIFIDQHKYEALAFPLGQLPEILKQKTIPYFRTTQALENLNRLTRSNLLWDEVIDGIKKNYLFHESAHLVARATFGEPPSAADIAKRNDLVLQVLLEESYANTCEAIAIVDVQDTAHRCFFEVFSYSVLTEERSLIQKMMHEFSPSKIFLFMHLCFLTSNFLKESISDSEFKRILELSELKYPSASLKQLKALSRIAQTLDPRFKNVTSQLFFKIIGLDEPLNKLLNFDFLEVIYESPKRISKLRDLSQLVFDKK